MSRIRCFVAVTPDTQGHFTDNPALINEYICHIQGIHCLLTGKAEGGDEPLALAVLGGTRFAAYLVRNHLRLVQFDQVAVAARGDGVIQWLS